jgi:hypothetical protein
MAHLSTGFAVSSTPLRTTPQLLENGGLSTYRKPLIDARDMEHVEAWEHAQLVPIGVGAKTYAADTVIFVLRSLPAFVCHQLNKRLIEILFAWTVELASRANAKGLPLEQTQKGPMLLGP